MAQGRSDRYAVLEGIVSSVQRTVYPAHDPDTDRAVAPKVLRRDLPRYSRYVERFRREATLVASIDHPNIFRIFEVIEAGSLHFTRVESPPVSLSRAIETRALPVEVCQRAYDGAALAPAHRVFTEGRTLCT